ncbi:hypothetical protein GCM10020216_031140 [Nonomuraea helvata]
MVDAAGRASPGRFFARRKPNPLRMSLTVETDGAPLAETRFERTFTDQDILERTAPYDSGLTGTLYSRDEAAPGVIMLGGSDGGRLDHSAALLATRGYTVLSLGYFGVEDRPAHLIHIDPRLLLPGHHLAHRTTRSERTAGGDHRAVPWRGTRTPGRRTG